MTKIHDSIAMWGSNLARYSTVILLVLVAQGSNFVRADDAVKSDDKEAAYTAEINKRADKIVATLEIKDEASRARLRDLIAGQYRNLRNIHAARDARIDESKRSPGGDKTIAEAWTKVARDAATIQLSESHRRFIARLAAELTPEQVDQVKDGMTYGVVKVTYGRYLQLFPELRDEQKREILASLIEAREYAMDAGSSEEKHAIFGKYKGRINNYLSAAGYNMRQAEKNLAEKQKRDPQK
jgi:hypothetical protein